MPYPNHASEIAFREMGEETVVIELGSKRLFHELNPVGSLIWKFCDGTKSTEDITHEVCNHFQVEFNQAFQEVKDFLEDLTSRELITWNN